MKRKYYLLILLGFGLLTRFLFFGYPNETVFDEVHFGKFISGYYTNEYFFDIHPPAGKLIIAGFARMFNFQPEFGFTQIGNKYPDKQYQILRFLPSLAGALLPLVIFLLLLELKVSTFSSFIGGLLIVLENSLLTQARFILLDSFLLLFGFLAILFFFKYYSATHNTKNLIFFGIFSGLAVSIKWTGLGFLALPLLFEIINLLKKRHFKLMIWLLIPMATALIIYSLFFVIHLTILNKSGPGDAFMNSGFQKTLSGNTHEKDENIKKSNIIQKFSELNVVMYKANQGLTAKHPYSSQWYSWPLMTRPIYYWVRDNARIYLIGNPVIWWFSSATVLWTIIISLAQIAKRKAQKSLKQSFGQLTINSLPLAFLMASYTVNMLPFIGVQRVMFLYHYFTAYVFSIMILVWLIDQKSSDSVQIKNPAPFYKKYGIGILLILSIASFIFFAPLNYGLELKSDQYEYRIWFSSWK